MTTTLTEQLTAAQAEAARQGEQLAALEAKLSTAVAAEEYTTAETLKADLPPVRDAWALAEARARALQQVLGELAEQETARRAEHDAELRRQEARRQVDVAMAAEREALAEIARRWADVAPGLDAVRESMRAAVAAEGRAWQARSDAESAMVVLGERDAGVRVPKPNAASAKIEADRLLYMIFHNQRP